MYIDFEKLKKEMIKETTATNVKIEQFEKALDILYKNKKYEESLSLCTKTLDLLNFEKIEDLELIYRVKKQIIKVYNSSAIQHIQKGENEMAKYYLDLSEKFLYGDYESYMVTKNNFCCYYTSVKQQRNARNLMNELLKLNLLKKTEELIIDNSDQYNEDLNKNCINYNDIANNYSNLCGIDNQLKNYYDAFMNGLHSLTLNQLTILNEKMINRKNKISTAKTDSSILTVSYWNVGVQQEYLKRIHDCKLSFDKSRNFSANGSGKKLTIDKKFLKKINTERDDNYSPQNHTCDIKY